MFAFALTLKNLFWYFALYGLLSFSIMRIAGSTKKKKVLTYAPTETFFENICSKISFVCRFLFMLISFFIPLLFETPIFYIGTIIYLIGLVLSTLALWQYTHVPSDQLITSGLYRISRHPMQVMFYIMCIGIAIISMNIILMFLILIYIITSYPALLVQERFCIKMYGDQYCDYQKQTPKILFKF